jgi:hypothetical protein
MPLFAVSGWVITAAVASSITAVVAVAALVVAMRVWYHDRSQTGTSVNHDRKRQRVTAKNGSTAVV